MAIQCPKCGGEHVQAVKVILQSGTSFSSGTMTGLGVGTEGVGTYVGTSSGTSQTTLAARFSAPKKPALWAEIAIGLIALATSPWLAAHGPDAGFRYASLAVWAFFAYSFWGYRKKSAAYKVYYPKWKAMYDSGFFCHKCGNTFVV
jgi:predicted nucleic-acid-binding Zn-ribbon protein